MASLPFSQTSASPAARIFKITAGAGLLENGPCRGLLLGTGGAVTMHDGADELKAAVPMQQGYNPVACSRVISTADSDIWALY